jgi:copper chaperone CopZ
VEGVDGVSADHEKGMAEATYRPRAVDVDTLKSEIEKLGYTVIGMETTPVES